LISDVMKRLSVKSSRKLARPTHSPSPISGESVKLSCTTLAAG
jgi:hypothetical protein